MMLKRIKKGFPLGKQAQGTQKKLSTNYLSLTLQKQDHRTFIQ